METGDLIPHLFRTEYRKIVSVLVRRYGFDQMETAEDIAGETFLAAAQTWSYKGLPENPTAWLYHVAKNKAKNFLGRTSHFDRRIVPLLQHEALQSESEIDLSEPNIGDSQLRMMFAICHPSLPPEAQVGLALRILCGFSIDEIADAFLTTRATIEKRLTRAREKLRKGKIRMEVPDAMKRSRVDWTMSFAPCTSFSQRVVMRLTEKRPPAVSCARRRCDCALFSWKWI